MNAERDDKVLTYAITAMIMNGMDLNTNGRWEESQLTPQLQAIIQKYRPHFEGESVMAEVSVGDVVVNDE